MIDFHKPELSRREEYLPYLKSAAHRGCGYSFANLYMWGRQSLAFLDGHLAIFSHFDGHTMYLFPAGSGEVKPVLDALIQDARERGIPFRLTGVTPQEREVLEQLYPGQFRFHWGRDSHDYVYAIDDLAELKGRKFQQKRNHVNRFLAEHPDSYVKPLAEDTLPDFQAMAQKWYDQRLLEDPAADLQMERKALCRAFRHFRELELEGLALYADGTVVAMAMGSFLSDDTFDIHFEKADGQLSGSYAAINRAFARSLREKHPNLRYLNREEDMGIPGLRKAKLSYQPHHMVERGWALLRTEEYDD